MVVRNIKDLLLAKLNYDVSSELKYQELMDAKLAKFEEEELPENALDNAIVDLPSWEVLEDEAWNLIITKGINWKLFILWLECAISSEGWDYCLTMINTFQEILLKRKDLLEEEETSEKKLLLIGYFDKSIARCLTYSYIKHEHPLCEYSKYLNEKSFEKLYDILKIISDKDYQEYINIYENGTSILKGLINVFSDFTIHFPAIFEVLTTLNTIMDIYDNEFIAEEEEILEEAPEKINESDEKKINSRQEAFKKIAEAYEILKNEEYSELTVPLLRKILRWHHQSISETLNELSDKEGSYHILKFLKD